jgi:Domain of unknown function (DUF4160)
MFAKEHGIPHIHARRGSYARKGKGGSGMRVGVFNMKTGRMMEGTLSATDAARVTAWISIRQKELEEDAKLIVAGKRVKKIDPLR